MMELQERLSLFKNEIEDIKDKKLKEFAKALIAEAPDYFFTCPASSTGKYHPTLSLGEGGLVRHTRLVVWCAEQLSVAQMLDQDCTDMLIVSAIAHDIKKHGDGSTKYTVNEHPRLAAEYMEKVWSENSYYVSIETLDTMKGMVESHMGQWGTKDGLPLPKSVLEITLHSSDYIASRKEIESFAFRPTESTKEQINEENEQADTAQAESVSEYIVTFGKYKGMTLDQIQKGATDGTSYLSWVANAKDFTNIEAQEKIKQFIQQTQKL